MRISDWSSDVCSSDLGELPPGAKLPPQRNLAWKLGVTVGTVSRGYMLAEQKGLLSGEVGRGTFVKANGIHAGGVRPEHPGLDAIRLNGPAPTEAGAGEILSLATRSEEHTSELQSLMRTSYAVFCLNTKIKDQLCTHS